MRSTMAWRCVALLLATGVARTAAAQVPAPVAAAPRIAAVVGQLHAATHHFEVLVTRDSAAMPVGSHTITISEGAYAGQPAWTIAEQRESREPFVPMTATDTVLLSRATLRPLRWEGHAAGARFVAAFANDSVYGGATAGTARTSFSVAAGPAMVTSEGALDALVRAAPLTAGWRTDATMLVADLGGARVVPVQLAVEREAQLELPVGTFDVWVVRVTTEGGVRVLWVDKPTQVVVRAATLAPHMPGMVVERILSEW
jgi:hypothetical protein